MKSPARPLALDNHSGEAEPSAERITEVQVVVLDILRTAGPVTDDALIALYESRAEHYPGVPKASPQSVRSRRAELVRKGLIRATDLAGVSRYGNRATVWALSHTSAT
ncbi:hypothetical protein [Microbacterium lacticum]